MRRKRVGTNDAEIGWISSTDVFLLSTCVLLIVMVSLPNESILEARVRELATKVDSASRDAAESKAALEAAKGETQELQAEMADLSEEVADNARLIGISPKLDDVILLVDTSKSMVQNTTEWEVSKGIIRLWLTHLPIKRCTLVRFDSSIDVSYHEEIPSLEDSKARATSVEGIMDHLPSFSDSSESMTDLLRAVKRALEEPTPDAYFLFSDGLPTVDVNGVNIEPDPFDKGNASRQERQDRVMVEVINECEKKHAPVNVIGMGSFFSQKQQHFNITIRNEGTDRFIQLANQTGGFFIKSAISQD